MKPKEGPMAKVVKAAMLNAAKYADKSRKSRRQICTEGGLNPATLTAMLAKGVKSPTLDVFARICDGMDMHIMTVIAGNLHSAIDVPGAPDMVACGDVRLLHAPPLSEAHDWKAAASGLRPTVAVYGRDAKNTLAVTIDNDTGAAIAPRGSVIQYRTDLKEPEHGDLVLVKLANVGRTELRRWAPTYDDQNKIDQIVLEPLAAGYPARIISKRTGHLVLGTVSEVRRGLV